MFNTSQSIGLVFQSFGKYLHLQDRRHLQISALWLHDLDILQEMCPGPNHLRRRKSPTPGLMSSS